MGKIVNEKNEKVKEKIKAHLDEISKLKKRLQKGTVNHDENRNSVSFSWCINGKTHIKYFSVAELGLKKAIKKAEDYRFVVFPPTDSD